MLSFVAGDAAHRFAVKIGAGRTFDAGLQIAEVGAVEA
jgi:hypothetical protein